MGIDHGFAHRQRRQQLHSGRNGRSLGQGELKPLATNLILELVGGALGDHLAVIDDRDLVGEPIGLFEILGGEQHCGALGDQFADQVPHPEPASGVEPSRGLVEEEHARLGDQGPCEVEPAAHASRVPLDRPVAGIGQLESLQQLPGPRSAPFPAQVVETAHHVEVLESCEVLVDRRILAGDPDQLAELGGLGGDVEPEHLCPALLGLEKGGEDPDRGCLAGAVGAEQPEHRGLGYVQVEPVESYDGAVPLDQALRCDGMFQVISPLVTPGTIGWRRGYPEPVNLARIEDSSSPLWALACASLLVSRYRPTRAAGLIGHDIEGPPANWRKPSVPFDILERLPDVGPLQQVTADVASPVEHVAELLATHEDIHQRNLDPTDYRQPALRPGGESSIRVGGGDLQREIRPGDTCKLRGEDQQVGGIGQRRERPVEEERETEDILGLGELISVGKLPLDLTHAVLECEHDAWIDLQREVQVERAAASLLGMDVDLERLAE